MCGHNQHLWELRLGKQRCRQPTPGDDWGGGSPTIKADNVRLREIFIQRATQSVTEVRDCPRRLRGVMDGWCRAIRVLLFDQKRRAAAVRLGPRGAHGRTNRGFENLPPTMDFTCAPFPCS